MNIERAETFSIDVDYGLDFKAMAELSRCSLGRCVNDGFFPVVGSGKRSFRLRLWDMPHGASLRSIMGRRERVFAQIEHAFFFAAVHPDLQRVYSIAFPGSFSEFGGNTICPLLTSIGGGRSLVAYDISNTISVFNKVMLLV